MEQADATRGFVTIATGRQRYYDLARNLLRSYRLHCPDPAPFYLICDDPARAEGFDGVIVLDDADRSYNDKLRLPSLVPFDETIFIDADSLVYRDLNDFWRAFGDGPCFCVFGATLPLESGDGYFGADGVGDLADRVSYSTFFNGGVYYLRKGAELDRFDATARHILKNYRLYRFPMWRDPSDEAVYSLAMAAEGIRPLGSRADMLCYLPSCTWLSADIASGKLDFTCSWFSPGTYPNNRITGGYLLHFGTLQTRERLYLEETCKLDSALSGKPLGALGLAARRPLWLAQELAFKAWVRLPYKYRRAINRMLGRS